MKLNGAKCPICTEGRLARHVGEFTMEYKGGSITFMDHVSYLCPSCGEDFSAGGDSFTISLGDREQPSISNREETSIHTARNLLMKSALFI